MSHSTRWTFQIETHDILEEEMMKFAMEALENYLRRRGGQVISLNCEFFEPKAKESAS